MAKVYSKNKNKSVPEIIKNEVEINTILLWRLKNLKERRFVLVNTFSKSKITINPMPPKTTNKIVVIFITGFNT